MKFRLIYTETLTREAVVEANSFEEAKNNLGSRKVDEDIAIETECDYDGAKLIEKW